MKKLTIKRYVSMCVAIIAIMATLISTQSISSFASYEYETGDKSVEAVMISRESALRIGTTAGGGTVHYNTSTKKTWGESWAYGYGDTTYMYVYCEVTANGFTTLSASNSKNYNGSNVARSLTTEKLKCETTSGRHTYTYHTIIGGFCGTENYVGNQDW